MVRKVSNEIDRLEIAVEAEANRANRALSGMEKRLEKIAQSLEKVISLSNGKFDFGNSFDTGNLKKADNVIDNISRKMRNLQGKTFSSKKNNSNDLKYAVKPLKEISRLFKDSTLDFDVDGKSIQQLKQMLGSFEREYDRLKHKLDDKIELDVATGGNGELGGKDVYRTIQQMEQYENAIDRVTEALGRMQEQQSNFKIKRMGDDIVSGEEILRNVSKSGSMKQYSSKEIEDFIDNFAGKNVQKLYDYESVIKRLKSQLRELANQGKIEGDSQFDEKARQIARAEAELKRYKREMKNAAEAEVGLRKSKNEAEELANKMKKVSSAARKATNSIWSGFKNAGNAIANATKRLIGFHKQNKKGMPLGRMIGSSVLFSFVFQGISAIQNAIAEGSNNLVQYSNQYNATISSMVSALTYLKNAWAAAFAPIVNVVGPYISSFVKMIATALNAVGTFFAALTGKGFVVHAKKVTQDYGASLAKVGGGAGKAAKGLGDANKKAKDLQKTIFGFDQMNILNGPKDSGSGGSGGSGGTGGGGGGLELSPSDMFETVPVEGAIADFAKNLRDAFLKEDWEGLGEIMAGAVNKGLQKLYDVISWDNVGPKITKFCNAFTTTFNSLVDNIDWDLMGRTIGVGFNTVVNTLYLLVDGIDWKNLGKKFGIGFMGLVDEVDWKKFGNLLGAKFMIAWELFVGFVSKLDGKDIGKALADTFNGIFEEIDGKDIGEGVGKTVDVIIDAFREFLKKADWGKAGKEIWDGVKAAFKAASDEGENNGIIATAVISTVLWKAKVPGFVLNSVKKFLLEKLAGLTLDLSVKLANFKLSMGETSIVKAIKDFLVLKLTDGITLPSLSIKLGSFAMSPAGLEIATKILDSIWRGVQNLLPDWSWKLLGNIGAGLVLGAATCIPGGAIAGAIVGAITSGVDWSQVGKDIIKNVFNYDLANSCFEKMKEHFKKAFSGKGKWTDIGKNILLGIGQGILGALTFLVEPIADLFSWTWKEICKVFGIHSPATKMRPIGENILRGIIEGFKSVWDEITTVFSDFYENKVKPWFTFDKWKELGTKALEGLKNSFSKIGEKISEWISGTPLGFVIDIVGKMVGFEDKIKKKKKKVDGFKSEFKETSWKKGILSETVGKFIGLFTGKTEKGRWLKDAWGDFTAKFSKKSAARGLTSGTFGSYNAHYGTKSASRGLTSGNFGNFNAYYGSKSAKSGLTSGTFGSYNAYYGSKSARSGLTGGSWGNYNAYYGSKSSRSGLTNGNWGNFNAYYVTKSYAGRILSGAWGKFTAYFTEKSAKKGLLSGLWGNFTALFSGGRKNADGGVFSAGRWKPVTAYANGGFPSTSQLFIAREAGPELVGTIGGHTAVMNNDQIVSSVAAGVGSAVYRAMVAAGGNRGNEFHIHIGNREVTDYFIEEIRRRTMQTGNNPILV